MLDLGGGGGLLGEGVGVGGTAGLGAHHIGVLPIVFYGGHNGVTVVIRVPGSSMSAYKDDQIEKWEGIDARKERRKGVDTVSGEVHVSNKQDDG